MAASAIEKTKMDIEGRLREEAMNGPPLIASSLRLDERNGHLRGSRMLTCLSIRLYTVRIRLQQMRCVAACPSLLFNATTLQVVSRLRCSKMSRSHGWLCVQ